MTTSRKSDCSKPTAPARVEGNGMRSSIPLLICVCLVGAPAFATQPDFGTARLELTEMNRLEQEAFVEGNCEDLLDMLADDISFYANGREMTKEAAGTFCRRIPRPFPGTGEVRVRIQPVSRDAGYVVKTMTFPGTSRIEVVTKFWRKGAEGWKMEHFQSTVTEAAPLGAPTAREEAGSRELLLARFSAMARTIEEGDAAGFVSFYVDAPVHLPPGAPRNASQTEIASFLEGKLGIYEIDEPPTIVFSDDASLAYVYGEYRIEANPEKDIEAVNGGRFVTIWQRDGDTWKCAVDIWNSSDAEFAHH